MRKPCWTYFSRSSFSLAAAATWWWIWPRLSAYLTAKSATLASLLHQLGAFGQGELEKLGVERRIDPFVIEAEFRDGLVETSDFDNLYAPLQIDQEFDVGVGQVVVLGLCGDAL